MVKVYVQDETDNLMERIQGCPREYETGDNLIKALRKGIIIDRGGVDEVLTFQLELDAADEIEKLKEGLETILHIASLYPVDNEIKKVVNRLLS